MQKAIVTYTDEEHKEMFNKYMTFMNIIENTPVNELIDHTIDRGYSIYRFYGKVKERLVELLGRMPTADEIIFLVDGGFYHFGAYCFIGNDGYFSGKVNFD